MADLIHVPVLAFQPDIGDVFLREVCGPDRMETVVDHRTLHFEVQVQEPGRPPLPGADPRLVNGVILLIRFLDSVSLEHVKAVHRALPSHTVLPQVLAVYREPTESEFKMSCTSCGQKLWVRDSDAGRSGRCPHCRKVFLLPTQGGILKAYLMLSDATPIVQVIRGKPGTGRAVLAALLERIQAVSDAMKGQTMRVQIPSDDTSKG